VTIIAESIDKLLRSEYKLLATDTGMLI